MATMVHKGGRKRIGVSPQQTRIRRALAPMNLRYQRRPGPGKPRTEASFYEMAFMYYQYELFIATDGKKGMNQPMLATFFQCTISNIWNRLDDLTADPYYNPTRTTINRYIKSVTTTRAVA